MNIVIFGAPGSGKGTQSEKLIERYGLHHISTGELLRSHIQQGTPLGKVADTFISQGMLIPDELMIEVLAETLRSEEVRNSNGVIFDGFPRTIPQAEALSGLLKKELGSDIDAVVGLEVNENQLIERMLKRGETSGRSDDNIDTIRKRLDVYHRQTAPLKDYYIKNGKYYGVDGNDDIDSIFNSITKALDK